MIPKTNERDFTKEEGRKDALCSPISSLLGSWGARLLHPQQGPWEKAPDPIALRSKFTLEATGHSRLTVSLLMMVNNET